MICSNCGTECESKFCPNCGKEIQQKEIVVEELLNNDNEKSVNVLEETKKEMDNNIDEYDYGAQFDTNEDEAIENKMFVESFEETSKSEDKNEFTSKSILNEGNIKKTNVTSKSWFAILMLILFFPVGVYFMWKHKMFKKALRIVLSVILGLWFAFWALIFVVALIPCDHPETDTYTHTEPTLTETGLEVEYCTICDEDLDSWETDIKEPYVYDTAFNFGDEEFIDWINEISAAEVGYEDLELSSMGEDNTSYKVVMPEGDVGALILRHDEYDDICAIMVYFEDYKPAVALATFIGNKIDSDFSADSAFSKLAFDKPYIAADMTITRVNLDTDFEVTLLAPTEFVADILE